MHLKNRIFFQSAFIKVIFLRMGRSNFLFSEFKDNNKFLKINRSLLESNGGFRHLN